MAEETKERLPFEDVAVEEQQEDNEVKNDEKENNDPIKTAQLVSRFTEDGTEKTPEEIESDIRQIEALANSYPQIKEMEEYKNLVQIAADLKEKEKENDEDDEEEEEEDEEEEKNEKEEEIEEEKDDEDVFGISKRKEVKQVIDEKKVPKEIKEVIEKNYAIKDVNTFFSSVDKWRNDSQKYTEVSEEYKDVVAGLEDLPQPIKNAITAYAEAKDYYKAFTESGERLNYNLPFEEQDKEAVVQHYFSKKFEKLNDKFDEDEIDEDEYKERVDDLYDAAKTIYEVDKAKFDSLRVDLQKEIEAERAAIKKSANDSVENLKKEFPDFSAKDLQRIRQHLVNGDIENLFYEKDGSYKKNAAEMIALALYGKPLIEKIAKKSERKGESKANERLVSRGKKDAGSIRKSARASDKSKAMDAVNHLASSFKPDPYV